MTFQFIPFVLVRSLYRIAAAPVQSSYKESEGEVRSLPLSPYDLGDEISLFGGEILGVLRCHDKTLLL
jgi:hypothetical protein